MLRLPLSHDINANEYSSNQEIIMLEVNLDDIVSNEDQIMNYLNEIESKNKLNLKHLIIKKNNSSPLNVSQKNILKFILQKTKNSSYFFDFDLGNSLYHLNIIDLRYIFEEISLLNIKFMISLKKNPPPESSNIYELLREILTLLNQTPSCGILHVDYDDTIMSLKQIDIIKSQPNCLSIIDEINQQETVNYQFITTICSNTIEYNSLAKLIYSMCNILISLDLMKKNSINANLFDQLETLLNTLRVNNDLLFDYNNLSLRSLLSIHVNKIDDYSCSLILFNFIYASINWIESRQKEIGPRQLELISDIGNSLLQVSFEDRNIWQNEDKLMQFYAALLHFSFTFQLNKLTHNLIDKAISSLMAHYNFNKLINKMYEMGKPLHILALQSEDKEIIDLINTLYIRLDHPTFISEAEIAKIDANAYSISDSESKIKVVNEKNATLLVPWLISYGVHSDQLNEIGKQNQAEYEYKTALFMRSIEDQDNVNLLCRGFNKIPTTNIVVCTYNFKDGVGDFKNGLDAFFTLKQIAPKHTIKIIAYTDPLQLDNLIKMLKINFPRNKWAVGFYDDSVVENSPQESIQKINDIKIENIDILLLTSSTLNYYNYEEMAQLRMKLEAKSSIKAFLQKTYLCV